MAIFEHPVRVLLIEDRTDQSKLIMEHLQRARQAQFHVERVISLKDGLKRLADGGIDVVLSDLALHDSYGLDTLQHIQDQAWEIPIVLLTNIDEPQVALQAIEEGAQDYVTKGDMDAPKLERAILYAIIRHQRLVAVESYYRTRQQE